MSGPGDQTLHEGHLSVNNAGYRGLYRKLEGRAQKRGPNSALWDLGSFLEEVMPLELSLERTETYWSPGGTVGQDMPCSASLE